MNQQIFDFDYEQALQILIESQDIDSLLQFDPLAHAYFQYQFDYYMEFSWEYNDPYECDTMTEMSLFLRDLQDGWRF